MRILIALLAFVAAAAGAPLRRPVQCDTNGLIVYPTNINWEASGVGGGHTNGITAAMGTNIAQSVTGAATGTLWSTVNGLTNAGAVPDPLWWTNAAGRITVLPDTNNLYASGASDLGNYAWLVPSNLYAGYDPSNTGSIITNDADGVETGGAPAWEMWNGMGTIDYASTNGLLGSWDAMYTAPFPVVTAASRPVTNYAALGASAGGTTNWADAQGVIALPAVRTQWDLGAITNAGSAAASNAAAFYLAGEGALALGTGATAYAYAAAVGSTQATVRTQLATASNAAVNAIAATNGTAKGLTVNGGFTQATAATTNAFAGILAVGFTNPVTMTAPQNPMVSLMANGSMSIGNPSVTNFNPSDSALDIFASNKFVFVDSSGTGDWGIKFRGLSGGFDPIFGFFANGGTGKITLGSLSANYFLSLYSGNAERMLIYKTGNIVCGGSMTNASFAASGADGYRCSDGSKYTSIGGVPVYITSGNVTSKVTTGSYP